MWEGVIWVITDSMIALARDKDCGLPREERATIFQDRSLEEQAAMKRYRDGTSVKETIDSLVAKGGKPSFSRKDTLGKQYYKMLQRRLLTG